MLLLLSSVFSWLVCEHSDSSLTGSMESSVQCVKVNFLTFLIPCSRWRSRRALEVDGMVCRTWSWEDWWHVETAWCGWTVGHSQQNSDFRGVGSKTQIDCKSIEKLSIIFTLSKENDLTVYRCYWNKYYVTWIHSNIFVKDFLGQHIQSLWVCDLFLW